MKINLNSSTKRTVRILVHTISCATNIVTSKIVCFLCTTVIYRINVLSIKLDNFTLHEAADVKQIHQYEIVDVKQIHQYEAAYVKQRHQDEAAPRSRNSVDVSFFTVSYANYKW